MVQVVEHLYRWPNWVITEESASHLQVDSKTIEYEVTLQQNEEKTITYTARYIVVTGSNNIDRW
jgi:ribosome biogenesis SPOUT family RNA methylase Rps3